MIQVNHENTQFSHRLSSWEEPPIPRIEVSRTFRQPRDVVWGAISDLSSHHIWMKDAAKVTFLTDHSTGPGVRMEVLTIVGPLRTRDVLEVTSWEEGSHIEVAHRGIVRGRGMLAMYVADQGCQVSWTEELSFPWWLGGVATGWLAAPILKRLWSANLKRLEEMISDR